MYRDRVAKLITDVLAPANLLFALLLLIGWLSTRSAAGLGWGALAAVLSSGIPLAVVVVGVHLGYWSDIHVRVREQRYIPLIIAIGSGAVCIILLALLGAPRELVAAVASTLTGLLLGGLITLWWKVSGHTAASSATVAILVIASGPWLLPLFLLIPLIGWSRLVLRAHTLAQTLVGVPVGLVCTVVFAAVR